MPVGVSPGPLTVTWIGAGCPYSTLDVRRRRPRWLPDWIAFTVTCDSVPVVGPTRVSVAGPPGVPAGTTTSTDAVPVTSKPGSAAWAALSSVAVPSVVLPDLDRDLGVLGVQRRWSSTNPRRRRSRGHRARSSPERRPGRRRRPRSACSRASTWFAPAAELPPCSRPSPAGRSCRCPACSAPLFSSRKSSPPEARNEFTVTEYVVAEPIGVPLSHIPVTVPRVPTAACGGGSKV